MMSDPVASKCKKMLLPALADNLVFSTRIALCRTQIPSSLVRHKYEASPLLSAYGSACLVPLLAIY